MLKGQIENMLIDTVIRNEATRNEQMIHEYEALISDLPKGSLVCRKNQYYYLKCRQNGKLHDRYIGKDAALVDNLKSKLELRKHYTEMLAALKKEQKAIHKLLEERK